MIWAHIAYWLGALADYVTTRKGLECGFREGNPVVKYVLDKLPYDSEIELMLLKVGVYCLLLGLEAPPRVMWMFGALQLAAAIHNFRLLRKARVL